MTFLMWRNRGVKRGQEQRIFYEFSVAVTWVLDVFLFLVEVAGRILCGSVPNKSRAGNIQAKTHQSVPSIRQLLSRFIFPLIKFLSQVGQNRVLMPTQRCEFFFPPSSLSSPIPALRILNLYYGRSFLL